MVSTETLPCHINFSRGHGFSWLAMCPCNCHRGLAHCCAWHTHYWRDRICHKVNLLRVDRGFECSKKSNLPGWRWAMITKVALDRLSRSLHSGVCDSDGYCNAVVHSTISGRGRRRACASSNKHVCFWLSLLSDGGYRGGMTT